MVEDLEFLERWREQNVSGVMFSADHHLKALKMQLHKARFTIMNEFVHVPLTIAIATTSMYDLGLKLAFAALRTLLTSDRRPPVRQITLDAPLRDSLGLPVLRRAQEDDPT